MDIIVQKRNGSTEKYQPEKMVKIAMAAGLDPRQSLTLATHIYDWAITQTPPIPTSQIRDHMISELSQFSTSATNLYKWYESTKTDSSS